MKYLISGLCCSTMLSMAGLTALEALVDDGVPSTCTKEELMAFFPQQVVESVLIKSKIPPEQASEIAKELSQKDRELAKIVEDKAAKLDPNPFKDLSQRELAIKIYRETLYEVFAKVLKAHGVKSDDQIQALLEEMQAAKSKLFIECIRKQTASTDASSPPAAAAPPSS